MAFVYKRAFRNKWLGRPATNKGTVPATAGLPVPLAIGQTAAMFYGRIQNRSASAAAVALVGLLRDAHVVAGQWTNGTTTYADDTADALSSATDDFPLHSTTADDGCIVGAKMPFGAISIDVTTAGVGSTAQVIEYWNGAAWTEIAAAGMLSDIARAGAWAVGEQLVLFDPPADWVKGGLGTGVPADTYNIRLRATAGVITTAALARRIYVGIVLHSEDGVAANGVVEMFSEGVPVEIPVDCVAVGLAVSTADEGNSLTLMLA